MIGISRSTLTWIGIAAVLAGFLVCLAWTRPWDRFGKLHDEGLYFTSAQSLAEGNGLRLPSLPGEPTQVKYPVLYPWLLSWNWKWASSFSDSVFWAHAMTALFACWYLFACFWMFRQWSGLGDGSALACVALTAFHPFFLLLSGAVLTDVPFMALAVTAMALADRGYDSDRGRSWIAAAGLVAGLSLLMRSVGLALIAGIVVAGLARRDVRRAVLFGLIPIPFLAASVLWVSSHSEVLRLAQEGEPGWRQTWLYYTSYLQFWKLCVPTGDVLWAMVGKNLANLLQFPSSTCLFPLNDDGNVFLSMLSIALSAGIVAGIFRHAARYGWCSIHFVLLFHVPLILLWNFPIEGRLAILFLPLFYAGIWWEVRYLGSALLGAFRSTQPLVEKVIAGAVAVGLGLLLTLAFNEYFLNRPPLGAASQEYTERLREHEEVDRWVRRNTDLDTILLAAADVDVYLHTGRQAIWPMALTTALYYQPDAKLLHEQMDHYMDTGRRLGARFWIVTDDDLIPTAGSPLETRLAELHAAFPVVFRSTGGTFRVHDLACLQQPQRVACQEVARVLTPWNDRP